MIVHIVYSVHLYTLYTIHVPCAVQSILDILISGDPSTCTCNVYNKERDLCIHILWILLKLFKVPPENPITWQVKIYSFLKYYTHNNIWTFLVIRAQLNLRARVSKSFIYFDEKYSCSLSVMVTIIFRAVIDLIKDFRLTCRISLKLNGNNLFWLLSVLSPKLPKLAGKLGRTGDPGDYQNERTASVTCYSSNQSGSVDSEQTSWLVIFET